MNYRLLGYIILLFIANSSMAQNSHTTVFNIKDYGATGDGKTINTKAINDAIEAAVKAGGGTVFFPAGTYLSYSIRLKSHISLYLDQGCTLVAAAVTGNETYDKAEPNPHDQYQDFGHSHWHNSLIWGENLVDISILGSGVIYGKGLSRSFLASEGWEKRGIDPGIHLQEGIANKAIALKLCRNVLLKDFTIVYGGHFGILVTGVDNLTIDNIKMDTNRDGMDIDACNNVRISNCTVNSPNDDAICLKSSYALGYAKPTQNVTITNCQVSGYDLGTFYYGTYERKQASQVPDQEGPCGRIKFGTESNGGFKNITISNCVFEYSRGLALETVDGALLEDVVITNITMRDVTNSPFFLRLGARMRGPKDIPIGTLRRITISNINVYNADSHFASLITGIPSYAIEDVRFSNIRIYYRPIDSAESKIQTVVPEYEKLYPEPAKFGVLPAYGFFIRHVKSIAMDNVEVYHLGKEIRPAFILNDVNGADFFNVHAQPSQNQFNFVLKGVVGFKMDGTNNKSRNMDKVTELKF